MDSLDRKSIDSFLRLAGQSGYSSSLFVNTSNHHTAEHGDSSEGALAQQQGGEPIIDVEDEGSGKKRKLNATLKNEPDNDCINEEGGEPIDWLDASNPEKKRFGNTKRCKCCIAIIYLLSIVSSQYRSDVTTLHLFCPCSLQEEMV
jgi:hypothetical protein